ncbi:hypothetical protein KP509_33G031600 [Ceratopteris richardii]|uniref:C2H2-type domain-containing protein n=1 Tax=Ceratopteris richardii TaxID=49495 RepID=A0A8T2QPG1_CERRI|nr:hypothetical protein KP509_33G031600 [Ceratopteris richardii]
MEFWGVEVASGKPITCKPGPASYVHISQAAIGDSKNAKGNDRVILKVKVGTNEVVVGTLSQGKCDQTALDLIFEKDFVLSHTGSGSVYFCGYKTDAVRDEDMSSDEEDEFDVSDEGEEDDEKLQTKENVMKVSKSPAPASKPAPKPAATTAKTDVPVVDARSKAKPVIAEKKKEMKEDEDNSDEEDDEEDEDEEEEEGESDEDEDMMASGSDEDLDSEEEDESDESSDEEQPMTAGKKRPGSAVAAPSAGKKNKIDTPGKVEGKSTAPAVTPKQQQSGKKDNLAKKTPGKEASTPTPAKKLGQYTCDSCKKNFNTENALSQHAAAKHK